MPLLAAGAGATKGRRHRNPAARAVTKTEACRQLGVDKTTLVALIAEGAVRTIPWRGRTGGKISVRRERIPLSEIERLSEEGIPEPGPRPRGRRGTRRGAAPGLDVGARIRAIPLR